LPRGGQKPQKSNLYRFIVKHAPKNTLGIGPPPPPWENDEIYRIFRFFIEVGVVQRYVKPESKIGIYSKPPPKSGNYSDF
jgi:hypothetical protein